jgi:L-rhamnose isomerase/sugar isomerase
MVQTVDTAQELYAKAVLIDYERLSTAQRRCDLVESESVLRNAFSTDVRPMIQEWRRAKQLPSDPIDALRKSGYVDRVAADRAGRTSATSSYA